jgi:ERCC4-type nuclease
MQPSITIVIDHRERSSGIPRLLALRNVDVREEQLPVGDYILSERIAVERKQTPDFLDSLISHRLFDQVRRLAAAYPKPILIIEGNGLLERQVHEHAIYGAISAIITDYDFSIFTSSDVEETAHVLYSIANREQLPQTKEIPLRGRKPLRSVPEQQRFLIEGLPFVSAISAHRLLDHFGSVRRIMNATHAELCEVEGIGTKKALAIKEIIEYRWLSENLE